MSGIASPVIEKLIDSRRAQEEILLRRLVENLHARRKIERDIIAVCDERRAAEILMDAEIIFRHEVE